MDSEGSIPSFILTILHQSTEILIQEFGAGCVCVCVCVCVSVFGFVSECCVFSFIFIGNFLMLFPSLGVFLSFDRGYQNECQFYPPSSLVWFLSNGVKYSLMYVLNSSLWLLFFDNISKEQHKQRNQKRVVA